MPHTTSQRQRFLHRQTAHDHRLVIAHHGIAKAEKNVLHRHTFLLTVDDVRLGENGTAPGKARNRLRFCNVRSIVFERQAQARHLIFEKGTGSTGAVFVYRKARRRAAAQSCEKTCALTAHLDERACLRGQ